MKGCWKSSTRTGIRCGSAIWMIAAVLLLIVCAVAGLFVGPAPIAPGEVVRWLFWGELSDSYGILQHVRLPRSLAPLLCGMALAVSGVLLQSALNNPLASAGIIGINSGAGLFALLAGCLMPGVFAARNLFAFAGAMTAALLVFFVSARLGGSKSMIVMTGIAVSSLMSAGSDALITLRPDSLMDKNTFFIGGFAHVSMQQVLYAFPFLIIGMLGALLLAPHLDILLLGDEPAAALGLRVDSCRFFALLCAALLAASAVCIGGLLGFVGLMAPHAARALIGRGHRLLIPFAACLGGVLVGVCDMLARVLFRPFELPVGILLSFLGAPFFLFLLASRKRRGEA